MKSVMNEVPVVDYYEKMSSLLLKHLLEICRPETRALWNSGEGRKDLNIFMYNLGGSLGAVAGPPTHVSPNKTMGGVEGWSLDYNALPSGLKSELLSFRVSDAGQRQKFTQLQTKLTAAANSYNTLADLKKVLPEFEKHFPSPKPTARASDNRYPLAVVGVADIFKAAGWPKERA